MRMIPPHISNSTRSGAERTLFDRLSKLDFSSDTYCLHSVELPEHLYKVCGELDFVIVGSRGLYVIEVKGGNIACRDGIWYYTSRYGDSVHSSEGPFHQARSGMFSLRERLLRKMSSNELSQIVMGYGVAFPECDFDVQSIEWSHELVLDERYLKSHGLIAYLKNLETYWHRKLSYMPGKASPGLVKRIVKSIRPDFEQLRSLRVQANEIEGRLVRLTEEQYEKLDLVENSPRVLVEGGAGTGKTFLALEIARREAQNGQQVLFICFSPVLAQFLATQIDAPGVSVCSLHAFMLDIIRKYSKLPDDYRSDRPATDVWFVQQLTPVFNAAAANLSADQKFDVLVIDEAQDILNLDYLAALGNVLRGGLERGKWRMFYDRFNQGAIFGAIDPDVIDLLHDYQTAGGTLRVNCRNTNEIVIQTKLTTGADLGNESTGPGPEVIFSTYRDEKEAVRLLEEYLGNLLKKQVDPHEITILSPLPYEKASVSRLSSTLQRQITPLSSSQNLKFPFTRMTFATVADFKGLENNFIVLIDINDLDSTPAALANVYVGMSRARVQLWVAIHSQLRQRQQELAQKNLPKVMEDL